MRRDRAGLGVTALARRGLHEAIVRRTLYWTDSGGDQVVVFVDVVPTVAITLKGHTVVAAADGVAGNRRAVVRPA